MQGPGRRPAVVAFDIIGTVFPLEPLRPILMGMGLPRAGLEAWFAAGCRDAFALAATGDFQPFASVLRAALDEVLAEQALDVADEERDRLVGALAGLEPRDGAGEAFAALADAGVPVMALSNGTATTMRTLLAGASLAKWVRHLVSVEEVGLAKPRAEVYRHAARIAGVAPGQMALVAAHPWDIHGAAAAGLMTAYLTGDRPFSRVMRRPDLQQPTLPELVQSLLALPER